MVTVHEKLCDEIVVVLLQYYTRKKKRELEDGCPKAVLLSPKGERAKRTISD
jgi:hypothetical protein